MTRLKTFQLRKEAQLKDMYLLLSKLSNRARYILEVLSGNIDLRKKTNQQVVEMLEEFKFDKQEGDYKYLIKMPMDSVTEEHVDKIVREKEVTETELEILLKTSVEDMWLKELTVFEREYKSVRSKTVKK